MIKGSIKLYDNKPPPNQYSKYKYDDYGYGLPTDAAKQIDAQVEEALKLGFNINTKVKSKTHKEDRTGIICYFNRNPYVAWNMHTDTPEVLNVRWFDTGHCGNYSPDELEKA